jgi:putative hydrolase of the HAD superfamily
MERLRKIRRQFSGSFQKAPQKKQLAVRHSRGHSSGAAPVRLILCDLGNVLLNFDHRIAVRRILPYCAKSFDEVYQLFFDSPSTKDYEEGKISTRLFFRRVQRALGLRELAYRDFCTFWSEIFFDAIGMIAWLEELKKDFRLHLVSNINELHYRYIRKNFPRHLDVFDDIFLSYEVGHRKPHRAIYAQAIRASSCKASEVLYIDDREDLVRAAARQGIRSVPFRNVEDCRRLFKEMGIWPKVKKGVPS